jgi:GNAT superfamily N-acetyltransferase
MMSDRVKISFREATEADYGFLYSLHSLAMKPHVERTWGWDEQDQQRRFRMEFDPSSSQIVLVDGREVGVLAVNAGREDFIANIELLPAYQGRGIGTRILQDVLGESDRAGKTVGLRVLKVNPARRLYERLGFVLSGETETHYVMRRQPNPTEPVR